MKIIIGWKLVHPITTINLHFIFQLQNDNNDSRMNNVNDMSNFNYCQYV